MGRPRLWTVTPASEPLTGNRLPPGLRHCWPEVRAVWMHESGAALCVHVLGSTAAIVWRPKPHWGTWPHEVLTLDGADSMAAVMEQASALLTMGPPEEVAHAQESMRGKARDRAAANYRKKKEAKGPSSHDINREVRAALYRVLGDRAGLKEMKAEEPKSAQHVQVTPTAAATPAPKVGRPSIASQEAASSASTARMLEARAPHRAALLKSGLFSADIVDRYCGGAPERECLRWIMSPPGKAELATFRAAANAPHTD